MTYPDAFGDVDGTAPDGVPALGAVAGWLGALASLTLVAGLTVWVWDLATRDAGNVPVVRAMEGPARVAPEDPQGFEAAHQGLSVNSIASEADAPPLSDRVVLAPEPTGPTAADVSPLPAPRTTAGEDTDALRQAIDGALSEVLGDASEAAAPDADALPPATGTPPTESDAMNLLPRPAPRPGEEDLVTRAAAVTAPLAPAVAGREALDPQAIPPGTRLVQLGTFDSAADAEQGWAALEARFYDYLAPRARVVAAAEFGGARVYRLRAHGFDDLSDARAFCAVLLAENADCIPVLTR